MEWAIKVGTGVGMIPTLKWLMEFTMGKRFPTKYPGVFYRIAPRVGSSGTEHVFYAVYKQEGKLIETKVGRQYSDAMTAARAAIIRAELIEGKRVTRVQELAEKKKEESRVVWTVRSLWEEYKRRNPHLKGIANDENRFKNHLSSFQAVEPKNITTSDIDNLRLSLEKTGHKPATVRNVLELLRRIITFGIKKDLLEPGDMRAHFEMPQLNNDKTEDLSPDQLKSLINVLEKNKHKKVAKMMLLALYTGMRRGELFNLQWSHIDWEHGFINIVGNDDGLGAKSGRNERIPMNELARCLLLNIEKHPVSPYVFPGRTGDRLVDIRREAEALKKKAGLPDDFRPFHGLRHVYASLLASSGQVTMYELQKLMTHKSPAMTQRYAHLRDEALRKASDVTTDVIANIIGREI